MSCKNDTIKFYRCSKCLGQWGIGAGAPRIIRHWLLGALLQTISTVVAVAVVATVVRTDRCNNGRKNRRGNSAFNLSCRSKLNRIHKQSFIRQILRKIAYVATTISSQYVNANLLNVPYG